jgi:hypothetical protein
MNPYAERAAQDAQMASDAAAEAVALLTMGRPKDAAERLGETVRRAYNAKRDLTPHEVRVKLRDRYLKVLRRYCAVLAPHKFGEVADALLAVRDSELDVLSDENDQLVEQLNETRSTAAGS